MRKVTVAPEGMGLNNFVADQKGFFAMMRSDRIVALMYVHRRK
jgi:hypothetical protein